MGVFYSTLYRGDNLAAPDRIRRSSYLTEALVHMSHMR